MVKDINIIKTRSLSSGNKSIGYSITKGSFLKQTEIGLIPKDWEVKFVKEFTDCTAGGTPNTQIEKYWNGNIPWMNSGELNKKNIFKTENFITKAGLENSSTKLIPQNSVLIGLAGQGKTRGTIATNKIGLCINQSIGALLPNTNYVPKYLYYNLENRYEELRGLSSGDGGRGGLNLNILKHLQIPLPSISEQEMIAEALSDCDAWIESLEKVVAKKRLIKQGAMQELLTPKDDWEVKKLGELTKVFTKQTGFDYSAYIKPSLVSNKTEETIPFIQNKDFRNKWINLNTDYFIPKAVAIKFPKILLDEKSLLISISGSVGNVGVYELSDLAFIGGAVAILKLKNPLLIDWVSFYLQSDEGQIKLFSNVKSGSHQNLILDDIRKVEILFPDYKEQTRVITILSDMNAEIEALQQKLNKARQIKQGMMQELLTGKTRLI